MDGRSHFHREINKPKIFQAIGQKEDCQTSLQSSNNRNKNRSADQEKAPYQDTQEGRRPGELRGCESWRTGGKTGRARAGAAGKKKKKKRRRELALELDWNFPPSPVSTLAGPLLSSCPLEGAGINALAPRPREGGRLLEGFRGGQRRRPGELKTRAAKG